MVKADSTGPGHCCAELRGCPAQGEVEGAMGQRVRSLTLEKGELETWPYDSQDPSSLVTSVWMGSSQEWLGACFMVFLPQFWEQPINSVPDLGTALSATP